MASLTLSCLLSRPVCWESPEVDPLYKVVEDVLELAPRVALLDKCACPHIFNASPQLMYYYMHYHF